LRLSGIALDQEGNPGLLFGGWGVDTIQFARRVAGEWLLETVLGEIENNFDQLGLTYRPDGVPMLAWFDERYHQRDNILQLYEKPGDEWSLFSEIQGVSFSNQINFIFDSNNNLTTFTNAYPPLADHNTFGMLKLIDQEWLFSVVGVIGGGGPMSMIIDQNGNPALLTPHYNSKVPADGKRYTRLVDGEWVAEVIAPGYGSIDDRSLVLGADGNPLAAIYQEDERALYMYGPGL